MFLSMIGMARLPGAGHLETVSPSQHQIIQRFGFDKDLLLSGRLLVSGASMLVSLCSVIKKSRAVGGGDLDDPPRARAVGLLVVTIASEPQEPSFAQPSQRLPA
jgi:hypothetical protein